MLNCGNTCGCLSRRELNAKLQELDPLPIPDMPEMQSDDEDDSDSEDEDADGEVEVDEDSDPAVTEVPNGWSLCPGKLLNLIVELYNITPSDLPEGATRMFATLMCICYLVVGNDPKRYGSATAPKP